MGWTKPPQAATKAYAEPVTTPTSDATVDVIETDLPDAPDTAFRPVYTALDEDLEVEIVKHVSAENSPHQFGHVLISRPEWDEPKKALPQNVRVDVVDPDTE